MMLGTNGKPKMRHTCPPCGHVFLVEGVDRLVDMCIEHACTFHDVDLLERFTVEELRETIQRENENYWAHIAHLFPDDEVTTLLDEALCDREREIAQYVVRGYSNKEITGRLYISERTVSTHLVNIYDKLGVHSGAELTAMIRASDRIVEAALRLDETRHGGPFVGSKPRGMHDWMSRRTLQEPASTRAGTHPYSSYAFKEYVIHSIGPLHIVG